MPELEEVFRISTQNVQPKPRALERQLGRQRRRLWQRKVSVYATVAALVIVGLVVGGNLWYDRTAPAPGDRGTLSEGVAPTAEQLVGTWVTLGNGTGGLNVLFRSDGTFAMDPQQGVLNGQPAGSGTYVLDDGVLTMVNGAGTSGCAEGDGWTWEVRLLESGRLRTLNVDDATDICQLGAGEVWTWVRIPG